MNLGDTYFGSISHSDWSGTSRENFYNVPKFKAKRTGEPYPKLPSRLRAREQFKGNKSNWLQPKQLMLMPSRVAIAMQEDGWILRNDIIWHKPNPMPSSVKDRLNTTFEHLFHFVKARKYYYDLDSIREKTSSSGYEPFNRRVRDVKAGRIASSQYKSTEQELKSTNKLGYKADGKNYDNRGIIEARKKGIPDSQLNNPLGKNPGDVYGTGKSWHSHNEDIRLGQRKEGGSEVRLTHPMGKNPGDFISITTQPFPAAHFATYPEELCMKPIKSSCPKEICSKCGFIRERITETTLITDRITDDKGKVKEVREAGDKRNVLPRSRTGIDGHNEYKTKGFTTCKCKAKFISGIVLDPFSGSATTLLVAKKLKRNYMGFELSKEYIKIAEMRLKGCKGWQYKEREKNKTLV